MKKSKRKYKKAQRGIDNTPVFNNLKPKQDDYSWMDVNPAFPVNPAGNGANNIMQIQTQQGSSDPNAAPIVPLNPDGSYTFRRRVGTGVYRNNPYVDAFNYAAQGATAIGNIIQNNKLKNQEQLDMLHAIEPRYWENMQGEGLNNIPMYTQYGGSTYRGNSIVDFLNSRGENSSFKSRKEEFRKRFGTEKYEGTAEQNLKLLNSLRSGSSDKSGRPKLVPRKQLKAEASASAGEPKRGDMQSGIIVDKRKGKAYIIDNFGVAKEIDVLTGANVEGNKKRNASLEKTTFENKATPIGAYRMEGPGVGIPASFMDDYDYNIRSMVPIEAFGQPKPDDTSNQIAIHQTYDPKNRMKLYGTDKPYASYGCVNCKKPDMIDLMNRFPVGDTIQVVDSKTNPDFLKNYKRKKRAGGDDMSGCDDCDHKKAGGPSIAKAKEMLSDGTVNGKPLTERQKRYFGWIAGGKKQTGGSAVRSLTPTEMNEWNQFLDFVKTKGYEGSEELNQKNKNLGSTLFDEFKKANPTIGINYDIVPSVQNQMQILKQSTQDFARRKNMANADQLMTGISPVDGWFGSKTSQFRFPSATLVTKLNGNLIGQSNLGLVDSNLQATGTGAARRVPAVAPKGVAVETLYDEHGNVTGKGYEDPQTGNIVELKAGGRRKKKYVYQNGGLVEAEQGEIIEDEAGNITKISDREKKHESGGVKLRNVTRVLQDTSDKRKDKASKILALSPDEMEGLFGFRTDRSVTHSKAFELAKEHYDKQRKEIKLGNKRINSRSEIDKYSAKAAELNFNNMQNIPTDEDIMDALFMHQEMVKDINGIEDDGSMAKYGYDFRKAQAGIESPGYSRPGRGGNFYFDEATQRWYKPGTVPIKSAASALPVGTAPTGIVPYAGGRTPAGSTTPTGNPNAFNFTGGLEAYKSAWSPILDLSQYSKVQDAQQATYNYLVQNQPDVAARVWQDQGLTAKGRRMMTQGSPDYDPSFAAVANNVFDASGRLKPGVKLTPDQLGALTPAYADDLLGIRSVTPQQFTTEEAAAPAPQPRPKTVLDPSVNVNPRFINQPTNRFREPIYADELAPGLMGYIDSLARYPELYNPVQLSQLKYKQLDPTQALNANQADYNAALQTLENITPGSGAAAASIAGLQAQKYAANNAVQGAYDNQNVAIENKEIDYNTNVRDRQAIADANTRQGYYNNVLQSRENQRQQRLKSIEDISRVIQLKRRQNRSGNLIMKLSPAFDQFGEYNGYQYVPVLPPELGLNNELATLSTGKPQPKTKTTTSWKVGDKTVKREVRG